MYDRDLKLAFRGHFYQKCLFDELPLSDLYEMVNALFATNNIARRRPQIKMIL